MPLREPARGGRALLSPLLASLLLSGLSACAPAPPTAAQPEASRVPPDAVVPDDTGSAAVAAPATPPVAPDTATVAADPALPIDLATNEGAQQAYRRRFPGDRSSVCVGRPTRRPGVVVLGSAQQESFCTTRGVFLPDGRWLDLEPAARELLGAAFGVSSARRRAELARDWVETIALAFHEVLWRRPATFGGGPGSPAFAPPRARPLPDGGVEVVLWARQSAAEQADVFMRWRLRFAAAGELSDFESTAEVMRPWY
ncbi:MAG: hypothetical protein RBU45_20020 [Myxococcota bacterium]|jgi:hypothetical protein|nr:hypothetical protein [Myxococcota bacterium]